MKKRITNIKTFGKIISDTKKKIDFGNVYCCANARKCKQFTVLEKNIVKFDSNIILCTECADKIINQA